MFCAVLQRSPQVFVGESTGPNNDHAFAPELQAKHLIGIAIHLFSLELPATWPGHISAIADATIDMQAHCLGPDLLKSRILDIPALHHIHPHGVLLNLQHLPIQPKVAFVLLRCQRVDVPHDIKGRRVILVWSRCRARLVKQPIGRLRGIYTGEFVGIELPYTTNRRVLVENHHGLAMFFVHFRIADPCNARTDYTNVDLFWQISISGTDVVKGLFHLVQPVLTRCPANDLDERWDRVEGIAVSLQSQRFHVFIFLI
mmetsp:Transcript_6831/g.16619  ORF Transcript_6831/g.16619 Transcript_6831/m.16619 type:complete len:257 (+) Transcript_6831:791-1561(+)